MKNCKGDKVDNKERWAVLEQRKAVRKYHLALSEQFSKYIYTLPSNPKQDVF